MIIVGMNEQQKRDEITKYVKQWNIKHVIVFSPKKYMMELPKLEISIKQIEWDEVIMYRTFYPLLAEIDETYLIVVNEFMRNRNRVNLTYNCLRHYLNQCGKQLIFEYFPFIEEHDDFMILYDFDTNTKYKGNHLCADYLEEHASEIVIYKHDISIDVIKISLPNGAFEKYETRKNELFDKIGSANPDNIPRALELFCGIWKKKYIEEDKSYVARSSRFKKANVTTFKNVEYQKSYIIIDFMHKRLDMNDFFRVTQKKCYQFISTGLSIDNMYINSMNEWRDKYDGFIKKANEAGIHIL